MAAMLSLTACAQVSSDASVCPKIVAYSKPDQVRASDELRALPPGSVLALMIEDYGRERAQLRACQ